MPIILLGGLRTVGPPSGFEAAPASRETPPKALPTKRPSPALGPSEGRDRGRTSGEPGLRHCPERLLQTKPPGDASSAVRESLSKLANLPHSRRTQSFPCSRNSNELGQGRKARRFGKKL